MLICTVELSPLTFHGSLAYRYPCASGFVTWVFTVFGFAWVLYVIVDQIFFKNPAFSKIGGRLNVVVFSLLDQLLIPLVHTSF